MEATKKQVGGTHYSQLSMQPIEFIVKADLDFFQGNIVKYISRYQNKNGAEDVKKCIHYAELSIDLRGATYNANKLGVQNVGIAIAYSKANKFSEMQKNIIMAAAQHDYFKVKSYCLRLLKSEYSLT